MQDKKSKVERPSLAQQFRDAYKEAADKNVVSDEKFKKIGKKVSEVGWMIFWCLTIPIILAAIILSIL